MAEARTDLSIDLRGTPCPMNWVKMKLRLEEMEQGQVLEALLDDGEAILNVTRSTKAEGYRILQVAPVGDGFRLLIEKTPAQVVPDARRGGEKR